jgi:predicted Zn-dependent peptidase
MEYRMPGIETVHLRCGAVLVVERLADVKSAGISLLLPCGHAFDPPQRLGRAALWGELIMRGAGERDSRAQADAFDRIGASRGVQTGSFTMRLSATVLGRRVEEALTLIVDMIRRPRMDEADVSPAKALALSALESVKDDPQGYASIVLRAHHYPPPLDRSGLGTKEGILALTRGELLQGWVECARPREAIWALAGDVDAERAARELDGLLADWSGSNPEPGIAPIPERGYHHEPHDIGQVQIMIAFDAPPEPHPDSILEKFAVAVLSGGMSGRLFTEVREKRGLCYSVSAWYSGDRDMGTVTAYVGTQPERAQESLDVLWGELTRLSTPEGRIQPEEFERARIGLKSSLVFGGESTAARAQMLSADVRRLRRARTLAEVAAAVDAVTLDQLNAYLAARSLGRVTVVTLGRKPVRWKG